MAKRLELTGQRFGRLVALECAGRSGKNTHYRWRCICDCGEHTIVSVNHLRKGRIRSCGCLQKELTGERFRTHGMRHSPEYNSWLAMRRRCSEENHPLYHRYGGRGISVCTRWQGKEGFQNFFRDMGKRPGANYTLERIDNDGNYKPSNCRWATRKEQGLNTVRNRRFCYAGLNLTIPEWAERTGINQNTLNSRLLLYKWDIKSALTKPIRKVKKWRRSSTLGKSGLR